MKAKMIIALAVLAVTASAANAQTAAPVPAATTAAKASTLPADNKRIRQGRRSGELTATETARLKAQEAKVRQERKDVKADGTVTTEERKGLRKDKKKLSRNIYRQKHDGQTKN